MNRANFLMPKEQIRKLKNNESYYPAELARRDTKKSASSWSDRTIRDCIYKIRQATKREQRSVRTDLPDCPIQNCQESSEQLQKVIKCFEDQGYKVENVGQNFSNEAYAIEIKW